MKSTSDRSDWFWLPVPLAAVYILIVFTFVLGGLSQSRAQVNVQSDRRVSLDEALELFRENNLTLRLSRAKVSARRGELRQMRTYANPSLNVSHEPLYRGGEHTSETYVNVSQRIEWPGTRRARIEAAKSRARAASTRLAADSLSGRFEVLRAFFEAAAAEQRRDALQTVEQVFEEAARALSARHTGGEASGYEVRRLQAERRRFSDALAQTRLTLANARERLAMLILPGSNTGSVRPATDLQDLPPNVRVDRLIEQAQERHPRVAAARAELEAARASVQLARKERLPDPTITAGYKRQSNGFKGAFLGAGLSIPVLDRGSGRISARTAELEQAKTRLLQTRLEVTRDVRRAYRAYDSYRGRIEELRKASEPPRFILTAARTSYREDEMSLLELVDAAEAYQRTRLRSTDLLAGAWISYYDLLRAAGTDSLASNVNP